MNEMEALRWKAYKAVAYEIIAQSLQDLKTSPSRSASEFFESEWFDILCFAINADPSVIQGIALRMPGYIDKEGRRSSLSDGARDIIRGIHNRPVRATSPTGKRFIVYGSNGAATLIGCSRQAVSRAMNNRRTCMGWSLQSVRGGSL